jgi:hypothetical protein
LVKRWVGIAGAAKAAKKHWSLSSSSHAACPQPTRPPVPPPKPKYAPLPTGTQAVADALGSSEVMQSLGQRIRASQARLAAVLPLLPLAMRRHVRAGPIDETGWTLLADNPAVQAKLRQMLPALEAQLRHHGWPGPAIKVRVLAPS